MPGPQPMEMTPKMQSLTSTGRRPARLSHMSRVATEARPRTSATVRAPSGEGLRVAATTPHKEISDRSLVPAPAGACGWKHPRAPLLSGCGRKGQRRRFWVTSGPAARLRRESPWRRMRGGCTFICLSSGLVISLCLFPLPTSYVRALPVSFVWRAVGGRR